MPLINAELKMPAGNRMEVVSIVTPNALHYPFAKSLLENGFHLVCEKPMTMTVEEALELEKIVAKNKADFCPYPHIHRISDGEADEGSYFQGSAWYNSAD